MEELGIRLLACGENPLGGGGDGHETKGDPEDLQRMTRQIKRESVAVGQFLVIWVSMSASV